MFWADCLPVVSAFFLAFVYCLLYLLAVVIPPLILLDEQSYPPILARVPVIFQDRRTHCTRPAGSRNVPRIRYRSRR